MNADLYFEENIMDLVINQTKPVVMMADSTRTEDADYRFGLNGERIKLFGKHLTRNETDAEYVGIVKINSSFINSFKCRLKEMIVSHKVNCWWEDVLYSFIPEGVPICHFDVAGTFWTEIDDLKDYQRLQEWLESKRVSKTPEWPKPEQISALGKNEQCLRPI